MPSIKELPCWEIMHCSNSEQCPARQNQARPCWSLAREMADYRVEFDVCADCIVYMVKKDKIVMSKKEINEVRESDLIACALAVKK